MTYRQFILEACVMLGCAFFLGALLGAVVSLLLVMP
jgi:hypothetical protein